MSALAVVAVAVVGWSLWRESPPPAAAVSAGEAPRSGGRREPDLPRIDLARLDRPRPTAGIGHRDLFDFATPPPPPPPHVSSVAPIVEATPAPVLAPTPPPLGPMNIKYIGAFEGRRGLKVAVLMTDRKEVLTAQAGQVVANRFRIVRIGVESVDVQEVGSEQVRRIPLRAGN
jgi:hypothetical protein